MMLRLRLLRSGDDLDGLRAEPGPHPERRASSVHPDGSPRTVAVSHDVLQAAHEEAPAKALLNHRLLTPVTSEQAFVNSPWMRSQVSSKFGH